MNHYYKFKVMSRVIEFMILQLPRLEGNRSSILHKDCPYTIQRCICAHHKICRKIWHYKDWCTCEGSLDLLESSLTLLFQLIIIPLSLKRCDQVCQSRESHNKALVISYWSHKTPHLSDTSGCWPIHDGPNL